VLPWHAEWHGALRQGKDSATYWPLTHVEQWVPAVYAAAYVAGFVVALLTDS
jgi:hypothetical protein